MAEGREDRYMIEMTSRFHFAIPMRSREKPMEITSEHHPALESEYAVRYLEKIGVTPTPENMKLVTTYAPIDQCRVTAAWKSRGWVADTLYVTPHFQKPATPAATPTAGTAAAANAAAAAVGEADMHPFARKQDDQPEDMPRVMGHTQTTFNSMKDKYLYPFNAKEPSAGAPAGASFHSAGAAGTRGSVSSPPYGQVDDRFDSGRPGYVYSGTSIAEQRTGDDEPSKLEDPERFRQKIRYQELRDENDKIAQELSRPLDVTPKSISVIQKDFVRAFPFERLRRVVTAPEKAKLSTLLTSLPLTRIIGLVAHFLYWHVMRAKSDGARLPRRDSEQMYTALLKAFGELDIRIKARRSLVTLARPLVLLCVRSATEAALRAEYPLWFERVDREQSKSGPRPAPFDFAQLNALANVRTDDVDGVSGLRDDVTTTLQELDGIVAALLDPDRYSSSMSVFDSTREGLRMRSSAGRRKTPGSHVRDRFYTTSALVRSLFPTTSDETRFILAKQGSARSGAWVSTGGPPGSAKEVRHHRRKLDALRQRTPTVVAAHSFPHRNSAGTAFPGAMHSLASPTRTMSPRVRLKQREAPPLPAASDMQGTAPVANMGSAADADGANPFEFSRRRKSGGRPSTTSGRGSRTQSPASGTRRTRRIPGHPRRAGVVSMSELRSRGSQKSPQNAGGAGDFVPAGVAGRLGDTALRETTSRTAESIGVPSEPGTENLLNDNRTDGRSGDVLPNFAEADVLSTHHRAALYSVALKRAEGRYARDVGDPRNVGRARMLEAMRPHN